ncbi:LysR family transcriptional regulator [Rhizobium sp. KVB221]|uniref:HTH-type transcriptional regulator TtuA n=1 Tax=Rhizobium setariae TaxID=2801340 RepID=A0A936YKN9_9HYPH|nr:LysR substrate-binding domain-containing protein [Rhizobium setariae]MBL0371343.1 LysR family transcriptional regulator [Rhizobium setariae]
MTEKRPSPSVLWLRSFEAAARTLNFTAAGNEIGLTQAAISQHIKLLEAELGVPLFRRLQRGVELTAEGGAYLPHVQAAFRSLDRSTNDLFGTRSLETLTLLGPVSFMTLWLAPRLADFRATFPHVRLEMATMHLPADYLAGDYHFDIRFGMGDFIGRTSHRLTTETFLPAASPSLVSTLEDAGSWPSLPLLSVSGARELWPSWFSAAGLPPPAQPRLRFDSFITALEAACHGAGALLASRPLVDAHLADGRLVALSDFEMAADAAHFITFAAGRALKPLDSMFLDWMIAQSQPRS